MAATKKKPTAKQLAARKLFAQRAKAGMLKKNPKRPSQATGKKPTARLVDRRERSIPGYFPNPAPRKTAKRKKNPVVAGIKKAGAVQRAIAKVQQFRYHVITSMTETGKRTTVAGFILAKSAEEYAHALHAQMPGLWVRVEDMTK